MSGRIRAGGLYVVEPGEEGDAGPTFWTLELPLSYPLPTGDVLLALESHERGGLFLHSRSGFIGWIVKPRLEPSSSPPSRPWLRSVLR